MHLMLPVVPRLQSRAGVSPGPAAKRPAGDAPSGLLRIPKGIRAWDFRKALTLDRYDRPRSASQRLILALMACCLALQAGAAETADSAPQTATAPAATPNKNALDLLRSITHPPMPRFESWPKPPLLPPITNAPAPATQAEKAPVAQAAGDKTLFSFRAENLEMKSALALFARANNLNIVPDLDVTGAVTLDVRGLSLERLMQALLEAHDLAWTEEGGLIRVRATQTRNFVIDYLRMTREGQGSSLVTLSWGGRRGGGGGGGGGGGARVAVPAAAVPAAQGLAVPR